MTSGRDFQTERKEGFNDGYIQKKRERKAQQKDNSPTGGGRLNDPPSINTQRVCPIL